MRLSSEYHVHLFAITDAHETKLSESERLRVLHLLGELIWIVFEAQCPLVSPKETSDK